MAHEKVFGICENKCLVPVAPKTETDAVEERVTTLEAGEFDSAKIGTLKFDSVVMPTLTYNGYYSVTVSNNTSGKYESNGVEGVFPIVMSPFAINGVVSAKIGGPGNATLYIIGKSGLTSHALTPTQTEYTVTNAYNVYIQAYASYSESAGRTLTATIGLPVFE